MNCYRVSMVFSYSLGLRFMKDMFQHLGETGDVIVSQMDTTISLNMPKLPTEEQRNAICKLYMDAFNENAKMDLYIVHGEFKGYKDIQEIELKFEENPEINDICKEEN